jgi:hypothetical protein
MPAFGFAPPRQSEASSSAPSSGLRDRSAFGYLEPHGSGENFAQCATCVAWIKPRNRCVWFSDRDKAGAGDTCNEYKPGPPVTVPAKCTKVMTPTEAGFVEGPVRCENCVSQDARRDRCMLYENLNRSLPAIWALDPHIKPKACCNAQVQKRK